jgi:ribosomal-protein-alanine acetyltransferase
MIEEEVRRPGGIFLAAEEDDQLVGFAIGWNVLAELHVLQVAVRPTARRAGLGRKLMIALHEAARGAEAAWLEVRLDNMAAIHLYEGLSYAAVARRPRYYPDGCDAVVMRRKLP